MSVCGPAPRVNEAYGVPWWPETRFKPAEVEYIGPWPDGGTGTCVRTFPAESVAESNRLAQTFALAIRAGNGRPPSDRGEFWEIAV